MWEVFKVNNKVFTLGYFKCVLGTWRRISPVLADPITIIFIRRNITINSDQMVSNDKTFAFIIFPSRHVSRLDVTCLRNEHLAVHQSLIAKNYYNQIYSVTIVTVLP